MGAYHHITPPLLKEILMSTDLTWPSWPPPSKNFMGAYHHITPPLLKEILMTTDLAWQKRPPQLKFHRIIPSHYTSLTKGNFDDYRFDLTKKTLPPPAKISQVHTIMLHRPCYRKSRHNKNHVLPKRGTMLKKPSFIGPCLLPKFWNKKPKQPLGWL